MRRMTRFLILLAWAIAPAVAVAQSPALSANPPALTLTGTIGNGPIAASGQQQPRIEIPGCYQKFASSELGGGELAGRVGAVGFEPTCFVSLEFIRRRQAGAKL